jgi:hypothetical protein
VYILLNKINYFKIKLKKMDLIFSSDLEDKIAVDVPPGYDLPKEKHIKDLFTPGEYSKFSKIEEGQSDMRDYVKIISIDEENQPYRL